MAHSFFSDSEKKLLAKFIRGKLSREELAFKLVPLLTLEIIRKYLRVECEGVENIPKSGRAIVVSNHSGYAGFDALMLSNEIRRATKRIPKLVVHKLWFLGKPIKFVSENMGFIQAEMNESLRTLKNDELLLLFPEGEAGNFKPTNRRYHLQEFKRGFVRLSMITGAPVIPAVVIGAEETHINLSQISFTKYLLGSVIPIPLNVIPLPVKWKIRFLPPIDFKATPADAMDRQKVLKASREMKHRLQRTIIEELRKRKKEDK